MILDLWEVESCTKEDFVRALAEVLLSELQAGNAYNADGTEPMHVNFASLLACGPLLRPGHELHVGQNHDMRQV
jgi:hypothetical protein